MSESRRIDDVRVAFDRFELDRRTLELRCDGELVKLQQQPARVLALLMERPGELVTREELRQAIWGEETFVDFSRGLNYCINQIRAALGDTAESPRYIETLRGRGYRFVGTLGTTDAPPNQMETPSPVPARGPIRRWILAAVATAFVAIAAWATVLWMRSGPPSITVAQFDSGAENAQWSRSLHTQLLVQLSHATRLPVTDQSRWPRKYWRVEGRVDRSGEQYRVSVAIRQPDGAVRWSDIFDGPPGDWIDAQNEMAYIISRAVLYQVEGPAAGGIPRRAPRRPIPPGMTQDPGPMRESTPSPR